MPGTVEGMDLGFRGEVAQLYQRYRRGYPEPVIDALADAFALTSDDTVVDLGCGTGQLAVPLARRVASVIAIDPEPDMLAVGRGGTDARNIRWVVGSDREMPEIALRGPDSVGALVIGQALHWMDHAALFPAVAPMFRPGGGVAVVTNGVPLWLQDSAWSHALRDCLTEMFGSRPQRTCGTDDASQRRYATELAEAGYTVRSTTVDYTAALDVEQIVGNVYSALGVDRLPTVDRRPEFAERVRAAVAPHEPCTERVRVTILTGIRTPG